MPGTAFGRYVRNERQKAGLSLREVADAIGVSHVFFGEIERGARAPLKPERWPDLLRAIPTLSEKELRRNLEIDRPGQLELSDAPPCYQDLGLALARRIRAQDLGEFELKELMRILGDG